MSRIEQIKLEIEKRKLSALISSGDESDCNIDGSNLFNGHTLGASIDRVSWHSAIHQMKKTLPGVSSPKELIDNRFMNAANTLAGSRIKTDVGRTVAVSHILIDDESSQYPLEIGALNASCPNWKYSYFSPITRSTWDAMANERDSADEIHLTTEPTSDPTDDESFVEEGAFGVALPFQLISKCMDLLPLNTRNYLPDLIERLASQSRREAELFFVIDRAAGELVPNTTVELWVKYAQKTLTHDLIVHVDSFPLDDWDAVSKFESVLAVLASLSDKVRHDAESD